VTAPQEGSRVEEQRPDFFISYAQADVAWAEWLAWQLEEAGYGVLVQAWDFGAGSDFVTEMRRASARARRTLAVLSPAYVASGFAIAEWNAAFAADPSGVARKLLPVRVVDFVPDGLDAARVYVDLVDLAEPAARRRLLAAVRQGRTKPTSPPPFPCSTAVTPPFPGRVPSAGNALTRNGNNRPRRVQPAISPSTGGPVETSREPGPIHIPALFTRIIASSPKTGGLFGLGLVIAILVTGYVFIRGPVRHQEATCVLAFDASASSMYMQSQYSVWARQVIQDCSQYSSRIYALPVTDDTATNLIPPVDTRLDRRDMVSRERLQMTIDGLIRQVEAMVDKVRGSIGTDLLGLGPAVDDLLRNPVNSRRELVVFSDAVNTTGLDFRVIRLDGPGISDIIELLKNEHRLPDLRGVTVRLYGAGINNGGPDFPPQKLADIEQFWRGYFTAAGANLAAYARTP